METRDGTVEWRDLLPLTLLEKAWELFLPVPWIILSWWSFASGFFWLGVLGSFYLFLTGLRQSHGAQHYTLGVPRLVQDWILFALSLLMLGSMHAVQVSHLHHHRRCLQEDDAEGWTGRLSWWQAILAGPFFLIRLHTTAWRLGNKRKRIWIAFELLGIGAVILLALAVPSLEFLRWHVLAMLTGECLTGFFAVWTVHHDCDPDDLLARTQRGRWINLLCYSMFYHAEHHLYPAVPTCHLHQLATRLDQALPRFASQQVVRLP